MVSFMYKSVVQGRRGVHGNPPPPRRIGEIAYTPLNQTAVYLAVREK